jgi:hypothetical protein
MNRRHLIVGLAGLSSKQAMAENVKKTLQAGQGDPIPPNGFRNFEDLNRWAMTSSFGGARVEAIKPGLYYTIRSFTSGRASSEFALFAKKQGLLHPIVIIPLRLQECRVEREQEMVRVQYLEEKQFVTLIEIHSAHI